VTSTELRPTDRRHERRETRRAGILAEAWRLAHRDGLAAVSLRDLADAVGLRQPSLYVYFASKADLYDAMFAQGYQQLLDHFDQRDYTGDPRRALARMLADLTRFASDDIVRHQLLFQRTIPGFEPSDASYALARDFYARASAVIRAAGVRSQADLDIFTALVAGLAHQQVANDPGGTRWVRHADRAVELFLASADRRRRTPAPQRGKR
jgi:AcrR family transcriptional regulator